MVFMKEIGGRTKYNSVIFLSLNSSGWHVKRNKKVNNERQQQEPVCLAMITIVVTLIELSRMKKISQT